ncbi:MAG: hypothetical protein OXC25_11945 [Thiotrichales bacterium]|nr:hypothetical protein [Thiotrichales bacterium]MCY4350546.1 hypothetical protein [Thiotrichales bacterium]
MEIWEAILAGVLVLAVLYFFGPGAKRAAEEAPKAGAGDWKAALVPILLVAVFVVVMILMVSQA